MIVTGGDRYTKHKSRDEYLKPTQTLLYLRGLYQRSELEAAPVVAECAVCPPNETVTLGSRNKDLVHSPCLF